MTVDEKIDAALELHIVPSVVLEPLRTALKAKLNTIADVHTDMIIEEALKTFPLK